MEVNFTSPAPGIRLEKYHWGQHLEGTKAALIASGLAKRDWFARLNQFDKRGRRVRSKSVFIDGRWIETTEPARGPCIVRILKTPQEKIESDPHFARASPVQRRHAIACVLTANDAERGLFTRLMEKVITNPDWHPSKSEVALAKRQYGRGQAGNCSA